MPFNSEIFLLFFPLVTLGFFLLPPARRWVFLLAASYCFYMWGRPAFILSIIFLTLLLYGCGWGMGRAADRGGRKPWLILGLAGAVGMLLFLKYSNFLVGSFGGLVALAGFQPPAWKLGLPTPIGISFYTLQSLSYLLDVYNGRREPEPRLPKLALYVAFFPLLMSGPIERSTRLLPQFDHAPEPDFDRISSGLRLMLSGFFLKVVIADRAAGVVNQLYASPGVCPGPLLVGAAVLYAFQIYCDFAGYSNIAIGAARVLGYEVMPNFNRPYHAASVAEFWRRWHISLSTWFRDYLYIPLGGNRVIPSRLYGNLLLVFVISGFWHGANLTFIVWGLLHGSYMIIAIMTSDLRSRAAELVGLNRVPRISRALSVITTFILVAYAWVFFRAPDLSTALLITWRFFTGWGDLGLIAEQWQSIPVDIRYDAFLAVIFIFAMEVYHLLASRYDLNKAFLGLPVYARWGVDYLALFLIYVFGQFGQKSFIYFQF